MGYIYQRSWKDKAGNKHVSDALWIKYYRDGVAMRESTGSAKESDAKKLLRQREGAIANDEPVTPKITRVTIGELFQDVVNDYKVNGKRSIGNLERRIKMHLVPFFGGRRRASSVTTSDIRSFIVQRQAANASNAEINRELAIVKRSYSLATEAGKARAKPHIPMLRENNTRTGFFEPAQFEAVRKHMPEILQGLVTFVYITGWRCRSEVQSLQWRQVDFAAGRVRLDPGTTKNDEGREFPMTIELRAVLEQQRAMTDELQRNRGTICPLVFHRKGLRIVSLRRSFASACKKAGVPGRLLHDFRRTAVRNLVRAGIPERVAMQMTGHKTRSVFERYNIVSDGDLDDAARRLDEVTGTVLGTVTRKARNSSATSDVTPLDSIVRL